MALVAVKLTDQEWRLKCEELAKAELRRKEKRATRDAEAEDWKNRRGDLDSQIETLSELCERLATEVDTREAMIESQQELPLASEETQAEREPGEDG